MTYTPHHIEVFYLDEWNGWAAAVQDRIGNQIGEIDFAFHQADLIALYKSVCPCLPIRVFTRAGEHRFTHIPKIGVGHDHQIGV